MKMVFLRHGHAQDIFTAKVSQDSARPLSDMGKKEVFLAAVKIKRFGFKPHIIVSSPYLRAMTTAKIAADTLGCKIIKECEELTDSDIEKALNAIFNFGEGKDILAVGHQPLIGLIVSFLCDKENIAFPTSGFAILNISDKNDKKGELLAFGSGGDY
ncbi:MAG: hypothetical protein GX447_04575 [Elusimicrobia bacterium]|nr:hypothetical protein [Elusimicrobiota bacterium]